MRKEDLRIVYMGTPDFAVESLKALVEGGYNIVGVVTMPDTPMGRHGSVSQPSAVKRYAASVGLPVLQPEKLKDERFLEELRALRADLQIVVAFRMLPEVVWAMPRLGTFNLHASLLPQYRGAAPINWAVINGETETGVTTFFLTHEDTCRIDWSRPLKPIYDFIRGLSPYPAAWTELVAPDGKRLTLKIYQAEKCPVAHSFPVGSLHTDWKTYLDVVVEGGCLRLHSIQLAGKKRMDVADFLRGFQRIAEYRVE